MSFVTELYERRSKTFFENRSYMGLTLCMLGSIIFLISYIFEFELKGLWVFCIFILMIGILVLYSLKFGKDKIPHIKKGIMEIDGRGIQINNTFYPIDNIKSFKLNTHDYEGMSTGSGPNSFEPLYSIGITNTLSFESIEGEIVNVEFKLNSKPHKYELKEFIIQAIQKKLITVLEGTGVIGISGYADIQEFKKEIQNLEK